MGLTAIEDLTFFNDENWNQNIQPITQYYDELNLFGSSIREIRTYYQEDNLLSRSLGSIRPMARMARGAAPEAEERERGITFKAEFSDATNAEPMMTISKLKPSIPLADGDTLNVKVICLTSPDTIVPPS